MRALVTGVAGFVGSHLAELLIAQGVEVCGVAIPGGSLENLKQMQGDPGRAPRLRLLEGDIADSAGLVNSVREVRPDQVYHLAAASSVRRSLDDPAEAFRVNVLGTRNLLEAIRRVGISPRVLLVSSADAYGESARQPRPLEEEDPLLPLSPYGASKAAAEVIASRYAAEFGLDIVRVRPFPHTGPRHAGHFVFSDFARQVAEIKAGLREPVMRTGSLEVRRDVTDVRDMVRAYWLALARGSRGAVYNLCSEAVFSLREVLELLLDEASVAPALVTDPGRLRPHDIPILAGNGRRFRGQTGWAPTIPLARTLKDLFEYWRVRVGRPENSGGG